MSEPRYPISDEEQDAALIQRLAKALSTVPAVILALLDGAVDGAVMAEWPTGGHCTLFSEAMLADLLQTQRDVGRYGWEVVYEREQREREERHAAWRATHPLPPTAPRPQRRLRFFLYRLFGADDRLLYIGITRNLPGRLKAHHKRWGDAIVRHEAEEYDDHAEVLAAEKAAILAEQPPFNAEHIG